MADARARMQRLPPEVTRVLYVRNLPFKLSSEEMYDIFGKFGPIRQVRRPSVRCRCPSICGAWGMGVGGLAWAGEVGLRRVVTVGCAGAVEPSHRNAPWLGAAGVRVMHIPHP